MTRAQDRLLEVNSVRDANVYLMAGLTWQHYPTAIIALIRREPFASVAFSGKFWSMPK
jgi:hypothetical protein